MLSVELSRLHGSVIRRAATAQRGAEQDYVDLWRACAPDRFKVPGALGQRVHAQAAQGWRYASVRYSLEALGCFKSTGV